METTLDRLFLDCSVRRLRQLAERIEVCLGMLDGEQLWARGSRNENAIGNLVLHLTGNVRQWIVSGVGGRPDIRERDREFSAEGGIPVGDLLNRLHETLAEAEAAIDGLPPARLLEHVTIQNYGVTVLEAVYHVVEHFSMHTGQIIFATKMLTAADLGFYKHLSSAAHGRQTP